MGSSSRNLNNFIEHNKTLIGWATIVSCVVGILTLSLYFYDKWNDNGLTKFETIKSEQKKVDKIDQGKRIIKNPNFVVKNQLWIVPSVIFPNFPILA